MAGEHIAKFATGASSRAIAAHLAGVGDPRGDYPMDAADFGRCETLLTECPSLRDSFARMAEVNDYWAALVPAWDSIRTAEDQTAAIKAIIRPIQDDDPTHFRLSDTVSLSVDLGPDSIDKLAATAAEFIIADGKCSTSYVQRRLGIGYNRAARIVERLEELGVVTASDHVGKRAVVAKTLPKTLKAAAKDTTATRPPMKETEADRDVRNNAYRVTAAELRQFIERWERLDAEKKDIADQQKEVMAEAKGRGYDTKIIRKVIALRKRDKDDIAEEEAVLELYKEALGMA